jgi:ubiquinone/menaquinone biosynthesis C-methylase UbiE
MQKESKEINLKELEIQLSCPEGINGIEVAKRMSETNRKLIEKTIDSLKVNTNDTVLEIGHANGIHIDYLFEKAEGIKYIGVEISKTMHHEAIRLNQTFSKENRKEFTLFDGINIPYDDNTFDEIFTVNTIYFWENKVKYLAEIKRVLKTNGGLSIGFVDESSMKALPFVKDRFELFSKEKINKLIRETGLVIISELIGIENITNNMGKLIKRKSIVIRVKKP